MNSEGSVARIYKKRLLFAKFTVLLEILSVETQRLCSERKTGVGLVFCDPNFFWSTWGETAAGVVRAVPNDRSRRRLSELLLGSSSVLVGRLGSVPLPIVKCSAGNLCLYDYLDIRHYTGTCVAHFRLCLRMLKVVYWLLISLAFGSKSLVHLFYAFHLDEPGLDRGMTLGRPSHP